MYALLAAIADKKEQLEKLKPLSPGALLRLHRDCDIELTYSSNALEGNTLTLPETAEIIRHGITIGRKQLKQHLEAVDHYDAVLWMRKLASQDTPIDEAVIKELHRRIVARSEPEIAGVYTLDRLRTGDAPAVFPNPLSISEMMADLGREVEFGDRSPMAAFHAHFRLTAISPFRDGNGRTARLLMNLLLVRKGYVPVAVRPEDRKVYLDALGHGSLTNDLGPFQTLMHRRLDATLTDYLDCVRDSLADGEDEAVRLDV